MSSVTELRKLIEKVKVKMSSPGNSEQQKSANSELSDSERAEVAELEADLFDFPPLNGLLRTHPLYVARAEDCGGCPELVGFEREQLEFEIRRLERLVRLLGGQVHASLSSDTSHVLVPSVLESRYARC